MAEYLLSKGYQVKGSATSSDKVSVLKRQGIEAYQLQLNPAPTEDLDVLLKADILLINIPPKAGKQGNEFHPEQIRHLTLAIPQSPIKHVIYVSSTSVYPELKRTVIEDDVNEPQQSAAPALVEAEQLVLALAPGRTVTVLRCAGLMGYNRIPGKYVAGRTVDSGAVPVNYLHRDDAVGILAAIIQQKMAGTFNAVAPEHPTREAVYRKSCADFGYELPTFVEPEKPVSFKIIGSEKLLNELDYSFRFSNPLSFFYQSGPK
ncbi:SDR family NAD(P)-dependent oxidoreductase [Spirosoma sp. KNUC1025]|uniref:SDR family NAD(P)-dependent oxidoreductase n=1 Tax=Spirosoma sp. KNUC1025 TaxID=2894082 RepID=UPI00386ABB5F